MGLAVSAAGLLAPLFGWALVPGMVVSWAVFPRGIDTAGHRGGSFGAVFLGSAIFWAAILFPLVIAVGRRRRKAQGSRDKP